jgi:enoyl-[acyl-carrier-protein] reductase (NADH)
VSLKGKKRLIIVIANKNWIAHGCDEVLRNAGTELAERPVFNSG